MNNARYSAKLKKQINTHKQLKLLKTLKANPLKTNSVSIAMRLIDDLISMKGLQHSRQTSPLLIILTFIMQEVPKYPLTAAAYSQSRTFFPV